MEDMNLLLEKIPAEKWNDALAAAESLTDPGEVMALAESWDIDITEEQAQMLFDYAATLKIELSDSELNSVSGGFAYCDGLCLEKQHCL